MKSYGNAVQLKHFITFVAYYLMNQMKFNKKISSCPEILMQL